MIPLLLDQGLPMRAARVLRERGWDVVHVSERGMCMATDSDLLILAASEGRVVVTLDGDFPMLVALEHRDRPSVIHIRQQPMDPHRCVSVLEDLVPRFIHELRAGTIITIRDNGIRVRRLPVERSGRAG